MTTIAYKAGVIAYDSYLTNNTTIVDSKFNKMIERDDVIFFIAGEETVCHLLIETYLGRALPLEVNDTRITQMSKILIVDRATANFLYLGRFIDGVLKIVEVNTEEIFAIGSGSQLALGAMAFGATAKEAVEAVCGRDMATGGEVRTFNLEEYIHGVALKPELKIKEAITLRRIRYEEGIIKNKPSVPKPPPPANIPKDEGSGGILIGIVAAALVAVTISVITICLALH